MYFCNSNYCMYAGMKHSIINHDMAVRGVSSIFSRKMFSQIMDHDDVSYMRNLLQYYGFSELLELSISDILKKVYSMLSKNYRCEYVYKNELLNKRIIKDYGITHSIAFNEFKVGRSIADLALFNGESKAFEIKSDLDSTFRLSRQMSDYTRLFQKCYIVVPEEKVDEYLLNVGQNIGIIVLKQVMRHLEVEEVREAVANDNIDPKLVMGCLRTNEYKHLVKTYFDKLPEVSAFEMFVECSKMIESIPCHDLQLLFLREIESRKNSYTNIQMVQKELSQICLGMNMSLKNITSLNQRLQASLI